ncbi:MAG: glycosyltransferase family 4 protein [Planctomycetota bacterium]
MSEWRWLVSQFGARQHYAVPRAFQKRNHLRYFFTEAWCRWGASRLAAGPSSLRSFARRHHDELPSDKVISFTLAELARQFRRALAPRHRESRALYQEFLAMGRGFDQRVCRRIQRMPLDPTKDLFFGFENGSLATLRMLQGHGVVTLLDQMDPGKFEEELVREEASRWPGWQPLESGAPDEYHERIHEEWEAARVILVNSEWTKQGIVAHGANPDKIIVVPMAYEGSRVTTPKSDPKDRPLTVLWLGHVNLRKGIPYLLEAARKLSGMPIEFLVAGRIWIAEEKIRSAPSNVRFLGRVTRDRVAELYKRADLFVLPTISDGFAITQIEAMAHGLPVVATPNCGEVVTDGQDGRLVASRDADGLAAALAAFVDDPSLLERMSRQALEKSSSFTLENYADRVESAVARFRTAGKAPSFP